MGKTTQDGCIGLHRGKEVEFVGDISYDLLWHGDASRLSRDFH